MFWTTAAENGQKSVKHTEGVEAQKKSEEENTQPQKERLGSAKAGNSKPSCQESILGNKTSGGQKGLLGNTGGEEKTKKNGLKEEVSHELSTIPERRTDTISSPDQSLSPSPFLSLLPNPPDPPYPATNCGRLTKEMHRKQKAKG